MSNYCTEIAMQNATSFAVPQTHAEIITHLPIAFLTVFLPIEIYFIHKSKYRSIPWNTLSVVKIIFILILSTISVVALVVRRDYVEDALKLVCYTCIILLTIFHRLKGVQSSSIVFTYWLLTLNTVVLTRLFFSNTSNECLMMDVELVVLLALIILFAISDGPAAYQNINEKPTSAENFSPETTASSANKVLFLWFFQLTFLSCRGKLSKNSVWNLDPSMKCEYFVEEFTITTHQLIQRRCSKSMLKLNFFWNVIKSFGELILVAATQRFFLIISFFVCPFILKELIEYAKNEKTSQMGLYYSIILCIVSFVIAILNGQYNYNNKKFAMKVWSALVSTVYKKAMKANDHSTTESGLTTNVGSIINLLMHDADKFGQLSMILNTAWSTVITIVAASFFLWSILGISFLPGLFIIFAVILANYYLVEKLKELQKTQMFLKDQRVKMTDEILEGIKILKYYAWEDCFHQHLSVIRINEIDVLQKIAYIDVLKYVLWVLAPFMISLASFATYVWVEQNNVLTVEKAFVSITLFNILRFPLTSMPATITSINELWVSTERIIGFLQTDDYENRNGIPRTEDKAGEIRGGNFEWKTKELVLKEIDIEIPKSYLIAVCGKVASGKSSLLAAFLGNINMVSGDIRLKGTVAYVPQEPWIQQDTVCNNVLFGKPMDQILYDNVITVCELKEDIDLLPAGDNTEIGERGINLSGGQKQRIALARAIYSQSDIYLLDDPLSAVDFRVGKQIFENAIGPNGMLGDRTRILVTHDIYCVEAADEVYELQRCGFMRKIRSLQELLISTKDLIKNPEIKNNNSSIKFIDKTERLTAMKSFNKGGDLIKDEYLDFRIRILNNLLTYIAKMKYFYFCAILILSVGYHSLSIYANIWLSKWASNEQGDHHWYLSYYAAFGGLQGLALLLIGLSTVRAGIIASKYFHNTFLIKILKVSLTFFSETPSGRILNRFTQDIDKIDRVLSTSVRDCVMSWISVTSVFVLFIFTTPYFIVVAILAILVYLFLLWLHLSTSKILKRLTVISQSPILSHVTESLNGKSTIRAFDRTERFILDLETKIDNHQKFNYLFSASQCWLSVWLELIGATIITTVSLFVTLSPSDSMSSAKAGLILTYALSIIPQLQAMFRTTAEIETNIVAVERLKEYIDLPTEDEKRKGVLEECPDDWPGHGEIVFKNFYMTYRSDYLPALKNINLNIKGGQKVGIIGRTGAGKSSLISALIRMIQQSEGTLTIDGQDISRINVQHLRRQITIVPQESLLFSGTLRFNLDPHNKYDDEKLLVVLEKCRLMGLLEKHKGSLNFEIDGKKNNLSVGEKQMMCLARALLRKSKIMIFDEATSSIDDNNEEYLQKVIKEDLKDCTVLTIAHRLSNVKDCDLIIVLDNGEVIECDSPRNLLKNVNSYFFKNSKKDL